MKKQYEVIGGWGGAKRGDVIEADEDSVKSANVLGTKLKELATASAQNTPVGDGVDPAAGNGGQDDGKAKNTPAPVAKPVAPPPPPPKPPVPPAPKPPVPAATTNPAGAQPAVKPETK